TILSPFYNWRQPSLSYNINTSVHMFVEVTRNNNNNNNNNKLLIPICVLAFSSIFSNPVYRLSRISQLGLYVRLWS
ncbi:MAG: hypothetical protein N7Q72_03805, partial [Spiroplasma sp. Tabriz.8]|nr:hypothetical protein [Spiroplasma sp. Tabriz.8]